MTRINYTIILNIFTNSDYSACVILNVTNNGDEKKMKTELANFSRRILEAERAGVRAISGLTRSRLRRVNEYTSRRERGEWLFLDKNIVLC